MKILSFLASPDGAMACKWSVLLALAWTVNGILRARHPRWRLMLWRGALCIGLALPVASLVSFPRFTITLDSKAGSDVMVASPLVPRASDAPEDSLPVTAREPQTAPDIKQSSATRAAISPAIESSRLTIPWAKILAMAWGAGFLVCGFRLLRSQWRLDQIREASRPAGENLRRMAQGVRLQLGVRREVEVRVADTTASPFVCGVSRPLLILPEALETGESPEEMRALLAHELAHVRRHDVAWCVAWQWMRSVCWCHPLVWKIPAAHSLACEQEADRVAAGQWDGRAHYTRSLARLAERMLALPVAESELALHGTSQLVQRLRFLGRNTRETWNWKKSGMGFGLATLLFAAAIACNVSKGEPPGKLSLSAPPMKEAVLTIADKEGHPIGGAAIAVTGYRVKGIRWQDANGWDKTRLGPPPKVVTDHDGRATIKYPASGLPEPDDVTGKVFLLISHPQYVGKYFEFPVDGGEAPIRLTRGLALEVRGHFGADHVVVTNLVPTVSRSDVQLEDWQRQPDGALAMHSLSPGKHVLQLMGRLPSGEIVYSDVVPFTAEKGQDSRFDLEMKPGIRLEGRLDRRVARPVKNGRVLISVRPKGAAPVTSADWWKFQDEFGDLDAWSSYRMISEDGRFVFESIPPGGVDVTVEGDGFVSTNVGRMQMKPIRPGARMAEGPRLFAAIPQSFALTNPVTQIEVQTEPTATLELTAKTESGKPIGGAAFALFPNVINLGGSSLFGQMKHSSEKDFRDLPPLSDLYTATTGADGRLVISNIPAEVTHEIYLMTDQQFDLPMGPDGRHRSADAEFSPGQTTTIQLTLEVKSATPVMRAAAPPPEKAVDAIPEVSARKDPSLLKLGQAIVHFIRGSDMGVFTNDVFLTVDQIWALTQEAGVNQPSRAEVEEHLNGELALQTGFAHDVMEVMQDAGVDLSQASVEIKDASVGRLRRPPRAKSDSGTTGEKFKLKLAIQSNEKAKNGAPVSGEYILAADEIMRFPDGWRVSHDLHWVQFPPNVLDAGAAAKLESENYVSEHGTLPTESPAPNIEFTTVAGGKTMKLADFRGKVVVLDFWATWCGPCQAPMADMQSLAPSHPSWKDSVVLASISIDDSPALAKAHLVKRGWTNTFNVWAGPGGFQSQAAAAFRVRGVPTTYIIDARGNIVKAGHPFTMDVAREVDALLGTDR